MNGVITRCPISSPKKAGIPAMFATVRHMTQLFDIVGDFVKKIQRSQAALELFDIDQGATYELLYNWNRVRRKTLSPTIDSEEADHDHVLLPV